MSSVEYSFIAQCFHFCLCIFADHVLLFIFCLFVSQLTHKIIEFITVPITGGTDSCSLLVKYKDIFYSG